MQVADERGTGAAFRRGIRQVLFSGGDFTTVEYNVYTDVQAARLLFHSGVTIFQFSGEGEGKAYLTHADRQRLWQAQTPATWALQDLYRLWGAGWDPTSPFVPILYDVHPVALLIAGPGISRFEPMAVDVDEVGRLVRGGGPPTASVRVANNGDRLVELVVQRLTAPVPPAVNHLRALQRIAGPQADGVTAAVDQLLGRLEGGGAIDRAAVASALDSLEPKLTALGAESERARRHLQMARGFLLGESRSDAWSDPYTPRYIALTMPFHQAAGIAGKVVGVLAQRKVLALPLMVIAGLGLGLLAVRVRHLRRAR
jgi:hypothetical protein